MKLSNIYPSLSQKVVLITGGASGIGASLVESFCRQQATVCFIDIQDQAAAELIARVSSINNATTPVYYPCDLSITEELKRTVARTIKQFGRVDVLINNAANDTRHDFRDIDEAYWDSRIQLNLRHYFFAIQAVFDSMKKNQAGAIINMGSMSWHACQGGMTGYTTSKAAIEGLTRGLARDLAKYNIRINTLVPGWVMTERQKAEWLDAEALESIARNQCLTSELKPEHISAMALFLASDDSAMCTAQNFIVDGGWI